MATRRKSARLTEQNGPRTVISELIDSNNNQPAPILTELPSPAPIMQSKTAPHPTTPPSKQHDAVNHLSVNPLTLSPTSPSLRALWYQAKNEAAHGRAFWTEEQYVDDITVKFLYQPHTIIAIAVIIAYMIYSAFTHNDQLSMTESLQTGARVAAFFVIVLGMIVFPSGPFIRPHPLVWRSVFGVAVLYEIVLILLLFLSKDQARQALKFFYPYLGEPLEERAYADDCSFTFDNLWEGFADQYALSHFIGWVVKSIVLRDTLLCWIISIQWELLEIIFTHVMPNFAECWWDQWLLDVLICNGLGIYVGQKIVEWLEMKQYKWRGFMQYDTWGERIQRAVMQFTPQSWVKVRWQKTDNLKMFFFLQFLVFSFHWEEMNAFFLKHLLWIPPPCPLNVVRLLIWAFVGVPSLRQLYQYMTDPLCKRIGTQTFLAVLILMTETILIAKLSPGEFNNPAPPRIKMLIAGLFTIWLVFNAWMIRRIYKQEKKVFFAQGAKLAKIREESGSEDENTPKQS